MRYASNVEWTINDFGDLLDVNLNGENDIRVPNGVARIMPHAFGGCNELTSVIIPNSVIVIENAAFADCLYLTNVTIGTGVERIEDGAFSRCSHLTRVMIPDSVTYIGNGAFDDCEALTTFHVGEGNLAYKVVSGMLLTRDGTALVAVPGGLTEASIPNSVTSIRDCAFSGCRKLTSLTIPDKVTRIGASAFSECSNLTNVVIPASVTYIGDKAFLGCNGLADEDGFVIVRSVLYDYFGDGVDIAIPNSVTNIGRWALYCGSLTLALVPSRLKDIVSQNNPFFYSDTQIVYYDDSDWVDVTYDANGGYVAQSVANALKGHVRGYGIGNFPSALRSGYDFKGWYTDAENGEQVTAETIVEGNLTLYAHWEKLPVYLWVYDMVKSDSRDAVTMLDGDVASSPMAFPVPQNVEGSFVTSIVFQVKDGYEIDTITTNGAVVAEASGKKGVWTLNIDLQDCNSLRFVAEASARLENYGVVAEKAICERTDGGYSLTAKDGETLVKGDIALTAVLDGAIVDTTKGILQGDGQRTIGGWRPHTLLRLCSGSCDRYAAHSLYSFSQPDRLWRQANLARGYHVVGGLDDHCDVLPARTAPYRERRSR